MRRHKIRARILEELAKVAYAYSLLPDEETEGEPYQLGVSLALSEIAKRTGFEEREVQAQIQFLEHIGELEYISDGPDIGWYMLTSKGRMAYADEKYVSLSSEERLSFWGKRITLIATSGTLIISILALYNSWSSSSKNSEEFNKVNQRIDSVNLNFRKIIEGK
jgi:Rad3-related DNA helicase